MNNKEKVHKAKQNIESLNVSDDIKQNIYAQLKVYDKIVDQLEYQIERINTDKEISRNILDNTIEELTSSYDKVIDQNKVIEQQVKFREVLMANVNHELRTPLNAIIGMGYLLKKTDLNSQQLEYTNIIKKSADNLMIIINDFLTLSSINAGQLEFKDEIFSLKELFKDFSKIYKTSIDEKGIDFNISLDIGIPDFIRGDITRMNQIIQNLINNAIKFTSKGYVALHALVKNLNDDECVIEISVEDTGIGIPKHRQSEIFESFVQVKETKKDFMGTGLGLNIVQRLVGMMKGSVHLESEQNKGSKFILNIPFKIASYSEALDNQYAKSEEELEIPEDWKNLNFLMIEDNPANIIYARELFKKWKFNLTIAENYETGLDLGTNQYFDIILSDLKLPDGNGIDLLKNIRNNSEAKCTNSIMFMVTASILESDKSRAESINIAGYIEKPFVPDKLLNSLALVLQKEELKKKPLPSIPSNKKYLQTAEEHLNEIFSNDTKVKNEVLLIFQDQIIEECNKIEKGRREEDYNAIGDAAHKLKSTSRMIGINDFYKLLNNIEDATNNKSPFSELNIQIDALIKIKKQVLQELTPLFENAKIQAA